MEIENTIRQLRLKYICSKQQLEKLGRLTEAGVFCEELGELVAVIFLVATVGAIAEGRDADLG